MPLPHLDRLFDYLVPENMHDDVVVGGRVRVRFAGKLVDAFVLERVETSAHDRPLAYIQRAVSAEPVLSPEISELSRKIADRYAGSLIDVLRLAIPPRHADVEATSNAAMPPQTSALLGMSVPGAPKSARTQRLIPATTSAQETASTPMSTAGTTPRPGAATTSVPSPLQTPASVHVTTSVPPPSVERWSVYAHGAALVGALRDGRAPRAVWSALPGEDWAARIAELLAATLTSGRGALAVLPDARDVAALDHALTQLVGAEHHVVLAASLGPKERYRRWLAVRRGTVHCVIGTRAAAFAPVNNLGCVILWDDGDDLHAEPRSPYPHTREVLLTRAQLTDAGAVVAGFAQTPEAQVLVNTGWAQPVRPARVALRASAPRVLALEEDAQRIDGAAEQARLPTLAWRAARDALARNAPVLVQVPRRGYLPAVACARCRKPGRCKHCHGPLALQASAGIPGCRWCGRPAADWNCDACGSARLRASVVGASRTAEELGRAFPNVTIKRSSGDEVLSKVEDSPALVIATPGAEPIAAGGYGAALLLDPWALLTRADLRASQEALRRWLNAAALVRSAERGGVVVIMADSSLPVVQALVRWDPAGFAQRELGERQELGFPPAVRMAKVTGLPSAIEEFSTATQWPAAVEVLGPVPVGESATEQLLIRAPRRASDELARALKDAASIRSARKAPDPVKIVVDPQELS